MTKITVDKKEVTKEITEVAQGKKCSETIKRQRLRPSSGVTRDDLVNILGHDPKFRPR